jgi:hypothetical protein
VTDDVPRTSGGDPPTTAPASRTSPRWRPRYRWLIVAGVVVAAVLLLALCAGAGVVATTLARGAWDGAEPRGGWPRAGGPCLALEERLNRLAPPGAAPGPRERAVAIRNENAAIRPFLADLEQNRRDIDSHRRHDRIDDWRRLVDARVAYAEALDRQVRTGEPAFFVAPRDNRGRPVADALERTSGPCAAAVRRLAKPDL